MWVNYGKLILYNLEPSWNLCAAVREPNNNHALKKTICTICASFIQATVITKKVFDGPSTPAEAGRVGWTLTSQVVSYIVWILCLSGNDGIHGIYPRTEGHSTCGRSLGNQKLDCTDCTLVCTCFTFFMVAQVRSPQSWKCPGIF